MANTEYTEKQLKVISGETPIETISGKLAIWLYKKALANGDLELAEKARIRKEQAKAEAKKRNSERTIKNRALLRKGVYEWKQTKSPNYTEYQKKVIRGEISLNRVQSKDLIMIYQKATLNGDNVLAETILELIHYRHDELRKKDQRRNYYRYYNSIEFFKNYDSNSPLSKLEQAILQGVVELDNCSEENLIKLVRDLEHFGDEENLKIARLLLLYKQDPSTLYVTNNHWEAIDRIEELLGLPIRRPKSWFAIAQ